MIVFHSKPLVNLPALPSHFSKDEKRIITALLIEEHGVKLVQNNSAYELRSTIYKNGAYGNVVLGTRRKSATVANNKFFPLKQSEIPSDSLKMMSSLESKYDIDLTGAYRWTGKEGTMYDYAVFSSFDAFLSYIRRRLGLPDSLKNGGSIDKLLDTYSGGVKGYVAAVKSIYNKVNVLDI